MSILNLLRKEKDLPQKDFYTYEFFEHPEALKEAQPEKKALLALSSEERFRRLSKTVVINHLSPDGDRPTLKICPYLLRFPADTIVELLKELPKEQQVSLLNAPVKEKCYRFKPFLGFLPGSGGGYDTVSTKTVYETCLSNHFKKKKIANYVSSLDRATQNKIKNRNISALRNERDY